MKVIQNMSKKTRFVIVINWDNCDDEVYGPYNNETAAKKALKRIKSGWDSRDWYKASAEVSTLKAPI